MIIAGEGTQSFAALMDERERIVDQLARHARQTVGEVGGLLAETSDYALSNPGKLLRPLLMLEACRAAGGDPDVVFPAAAGTEYGHVASLIHDDIIDGDQERRGRPALHAKYDIPAAILTGDLFIFETFLSYTQCHERGASAEAVLTAIRLLSHTCIEVCRGQALEARIAGDLRTSEGAYLEMIGCKTASVCRTATRIGAVLSEADATIVEALSSFGHNLGMAFQIIDDVLSYQGHPTLIGKPVHSDLLNRRVTLPVIYALQSGDERACRRIEALFSDGDGDPVAAHTELGGILTETRALARAHALAQRYTSMAEQQLDLLPYTPSRECLRSLAEIFMGRDH